MKSYYTLNQPQIIQYDLAYIMSIRKNVSGKLPDITYHKVISYSKNRSFGRNSRFRRRERYNSKNIDFSMRRNPDSLDLNEIKQKVKKHMTITLNKLTIHNFNKMKEKLNDVVDSLNKLKNKKDKNEVHQLLMIILLNKAISDKSYSNLYAKILIELTNKTSVNYCEYIDNLFMDMKKSNQSNNFSKDYDTFCKQLNNKDKYINLFRFIGHLFQLYMIETVLIKKYIMILFNRIVKAKDIQSLELETNAHCLKHLLSICNNQMLYNIVIPKFEIIQKNKQYKPKFRFILMDIIEEYKKKFKLN